jgi:hypothetical protein
MNIKILQIEKKDYEKFQEIVKNNGSDNIRTFKEIVNYYIYNEGLENV